MGKAKKKQRFDVHKKKNIESYSVLFSDEHFTKRLGVQPATSLSPTISPSTSLSVLRRRHGGGGGGYVEKVVMGEEGAFHNFTTIYNLFFHPSSPYQTIGTICLHKLKLEGPKLSLLKYRE